MYRIVSTVNYLYIENQQKNDMYYQMKTFTTKKCMLIIFVDFVKERQISNNV